MTYYEWLVFFWPPSTLFIFIFETLNSIHMTGCDRDGTGRPILFFFLFFLYKIFKIFSESE
jgi:hypothetical protein